ncbi:MAG TPA: VWA domain-containing protein [Terriglobia bacterium]|nr:VWA domain-containing protein [Terriglobia bacterium]
MRSLILMTLIGLSATALTPVRSPEQESRSEGPYAIAVDVRLVVFNVTVTDNKGRNVSGLKATDFHIREENRSEQITFFSAADAPATVGLVIDNSGSMRDKRADATNAALAFVRVGNSDNEMFVVTFNEKPYLGLPSSIAFTNDLDQIRSALVRSPPTGLTALYDALAVGIERLKAGARERKALVVLSDGEDNASRHTLNDVLQLALRSNATIYAIAIDDAADPDRNPRALRKIAESTGGRAYFPRDLKGLEQVWRDIAEGIRNQYTIGYYASNTSRDGMFRRIEIAVSRSGLRVISRDGYYAPGATSTAR